MIREQWYAILSAKEVRPGKPVGVTRMSQKLVLWRKEDGSVACIADRCCHRGASLAAELGAASADHLVKTSREDIIALAKGNTVAVALPCTPFGLAEQHYTPAKDILAAGGLLAVASDLNPGTAWCGNMQFVIALACRYLKLTPAQAIAAATINAAAAIQRADRIGSLEVGKQADILVLSVSDYRHLGYQFGTNLVNTVIKRGQVC